MEEKKLSKLAQSILKSTTSRTSPSVLSKIVSDWENYFKRLKRYRSGQKLLLRHGPVVLGIELEKYKNDEYRPRVVLYNLIDTSSKLIAVVDQTIKNKKGLDVVIKYDLHEKEYYDACILLKNQSRLDLFADLDLEDIIAGIILFVENDSIGNCFWSCQSIMQLSRLLEDEKKKNKYFEKGLELMKKKIPVHLLDIQTKDITRWIAETKNLNEEKINISIAESLCKYKFEDL